MKQLTLTLCTLLLSSMAFAQNSTPKHNYRCIANMLEAYNSSIYSDLSPEEIDIYLETDRRESWKVRQVAEICDSQD